MLRLAPAGPWQPQGYMQCEEGFHLQAAGGVTLKVKGMVMVRMDSHACTQLHLVAGSHTAPPHAALTACLPCK
jgi:hypothetical protein